MWRGLAVAAQLRWGSRGIRSSHKVPKLTLVNKYLNLLFQLEAILGIEAVVTIVSTIFVLVLSSKGCFQMLGPFQKVLVLNLYSESSRPEVN